MTPTRFLSEARDLHRDIEFLDALREAASSTGAHPRIQQHLLARRNDLTRKLGALWGTRRVVAE